MFDVKDIRFDYTHEKAYGIEYNHTTNLNELHGFPNSMFIEEFLLRNGRFIQVSIKNYWHTSFYFSIAYLIGLAILKQWMSNRPAYDLKRELMYWNIFLAVFSIFGTIRCLPEFFEVITKHGLEYSYTRSSFVKDYRISAWYFLFNMSKVIELIDTVFIVLRKRKLIVLHWVHHVLTLCYSWYAMSDYVATARWMVNMNFFVHSCMYSYYAVMAAGYRIPKKISVTITTMQITQMFIGLYVNSFAFARKLRSLPLDGSLSVLLVGFILYFLFAILFINFFIRTYMIDLFTGGKKKPTDQPSSSSLSSSSSSKQFQDSSSTTTITNNNYLPNNQNENLKKTD